MIRAWAGLLLVMLCASSAFAVGVHDVRLWRAPDHTRIVFDLTGPAQHKLIELHNPSRIVLDIEDATLRDKLKTLDWKGTPVARIRSGVRDDANLRVVLDLKTPVDPRSFALKANAQAGDRLVVDLYDKKTQKAAVKKSVKQSAKRDVVIAIDAGHGGEDPGAIGP
ncbi:MAG: AMIN domain-containing protein, partial [Halioglobus sp.]